MAYPAAYRRNVDPGMYPANDNRRGGFQDPKPAGQPIRIPPLRWGKPSIPPSVFKPIPGGARDLLRRFIGRRMLGPIGWLQDLYDLYRLWRSLSWLWERWPGIAQNVPGWHKSWDCMRGPLVGPTRHFASLCASTAGAVAGCGNPPLPYVSGGIFTMIAVGACTFGNQNFQPGQGWVQDLPLPAMAPVWIPVPRWHPEFERRHITKPGIRPGMLPAPVFKPAPEALPYKALPALRPNDHPWTPREGPLKGPVPFRRIGGRVRLRRVTWPGTKVQPRPDPRPRIVSKPPNKPPDKKTKEVKLLTQGAATRLVKWAINAVTEYDDYLGALWWALPVEIRRKYKGRYIQERTRAVWENWGDIGFGKAMENLARNEIGDRLGGLIGRSFKKTYRNNPYYKRAVGIQSGPWDRGGPRVEVRDLNAPTKPRKVTPLRRI